MPITETKIPITGTFTLILGCLILPWYLYERSSLITNGYHCWQVPSSKSLLLKFESNRFISLHVRVSESNQPTNFLQRWKKVNFVCWLNSTFCVEKTYQKPRPSSINIIRTLLRRMEWFRSGLPNFVVAVWAQKPYQVPNKITTPEMINKIHDIVFEWPESESTWDSWDRIHLNWGCGQYFAYTFVHEKALCKMGAAIPHNRPKTHSWLAFFGIHIE